MNRRGFLLGLGGALAAPLVLGTGLKLIHQPALWTPPNALRGLIPWGDYYVVVVHPSVARELRDLQHLIFRHDDLFYNGCIIRETEKL